MSDIAFSTDWFLTIPGILITCGVILLIIALIMFIVGSKKGGKKESVPQNLNTSTDAPASVNGQEMNVAPVVDAPVVNLAQPEVVSPVASVEPMGPITEPVAPTTIIPAMPEVAPIQGVEITDSAPAVAVSEVPTVEVPAMTEVNPTPIPTVAEIPTIVPTEEVNVEEVEPVLEMPDALNLEKTSVDIYGGSTPVVPPIVEEARPIYGGADPLEATQNLPKVDVHHEPYSGGRELMQEAVPTVDVANTPVVAPVEVVTPIVDNVNPSPEVEPTPVVTNPRVVQIPDVEQL